jgi:hypothetical protein
MKMGDCEYFYGSFDLQSEEKQKRYSNTKIKLLHKMGDLLSQIYYFSLVI